MKKIKVWIAKKYYLFFVRGKENESTLQRWANLCYLLDIEDEIILWLNEIYTKMFAEKLQNLTNGTGSTQNNKVYKRNTNTGVDEFKTTHSSFDNKIKALKKYKEVIFDTMCSALSLIKNFPAEHIPKIVEAAMRAEETGKVYAFEEFAPFQNEYFSHYWYIGYYTRKMVRDLTQLYVLKDMGLTHWKLVVSTLCPYYKDHKNFAEKPFNLNTIPCDETGVPVLFHYGCACRPSISLEGFKKNKTKKNKRYYVPNKDIKYEVDLSSFSFHPKRKRDRAKKREIRR